MLLRALLIAVALAFAGVAQAAPDLKSAHASVDDALKVRKQKLDAWQRAQKLRDAAAADVSRQKKAGAPSEDALKHALALDEDAAHARSALLAAESDVASRGAALLRIYDAVLVERRRAVEGQPQGSSGRAQAVAGYRDLAAQRDAVRQALLPVLPHDDVKSAELPSGLDLDARPDDDVEALLDKADLARDLEERFLRQAESVHKRIAELEEEQAVARGVSGAVGRSQLFDEEDRRLPVVRSEPSSSTTTTEQHTGTQGARGTPSAPATGFGGGTNDGPTGTGAPPPADLATTPTTQSFSASSPTVVHGELPMKAGTSDGDLAGLLSSSSASVDSLKALEQKLKARAAELDAKQKKLRSSAH